jgi:hypothetical protein
LWTVNNGVQIRSGQGSRNIRLRFTTAIANSALLTVRASNNCGQSSTSSKTININLNCKTSDGETIVEFDNNELNAYPNPTSGRATITFTASMDAKYTLKVADVLGKVMINEDISAVEGFNMKEINFEGMSKGMYFITIQSEGRQSETLRLIVE